MDAATPIAAADSVSATLKRGVPRLEQPKPADEQAAKLRKLKKATSDFEAIFLNQLLKPLAKSVAGSVKGSQLGGEVMMEVAMEKMAETLADKGGIGLADILMESLKDRITGDSLQTGTQDDMEPDGIQYMKLQDDRNQSPMELRPVELRPIDDDKSQTSQVR